MKPILENTSRIGSTLPFLTQNFQASSESCRAGGSSSQPAEKPRLWQLTTQLFAQERANAIAEFVGFAVVGVLSCWPVVVMMHSVTRMVRNY